MLARVTVILACGAPSCTSSSTRPSGGTDASDAADVTDANAPQSVEDAAHRLPVGFPSDFHCEPTLDSIRSNLFASTCSFFTCHGGPDVAWGLRLDAANTDTVYDELVGKPAASCPGWTLVTPGDPAASFLFNKISEQPPACGERMPRGTVPLPSVALECVRGWIASLSSQ